MFSVDAKVDANNSRDLGASGARWKRGYFGTGLIVTGVDSGTVDGIIITNTSTTNNGLSMGVSSIEEAFIWNGSDTDMVFATDNAEKLRIDSSGRLLVGHTATVDTSTYNSKIQVMGTDAAASITVGRFGDNASASSIHLTKSRNTTVGNHGSGELHNDDVIGNIFWWGSDGGDYEEVARIGAAAEA